MKRYGYRFLIQCWKLNPLKRLTRNIIRKLNIPIDRFYKDTRYIGNFSVKLNQQKFQLYNPGDTTIENEVFWKGIDHSWEPISLDIWRKLCKKSHIILDIGANSGIYTVLAATINSNAKIFAFEPVIRTRNLLKQNIEINNFKNVTSFHQAVSDKTGTAIFHDVTSSSQYSASLNKDVLHSLPKEIKTTYSIETIRLDDLSEINQLPVDLIKLDVELHELEAMVGMRSIIQKNKPSILVEILNDTIGNQIEKELEGLGYVFYNIDEVNPPKITHKLSKSNFYNFLICQPNIAHSLGL
ncbi:MAG: FkbM family methyltransferase [Crocinitomicaceae bacterium]|nr:FkbM family methyltransferase [Crocinitomicaceae bacterium]